MRSGKNYLILFLALATLTTGTIAWQQYRELIVLRAAALNNDERAALQKRIWTTEQRRAELEKQVAARTDISGPADGATADSPTASFAEEPPARRAFRRPNFNAVMERPEMQKLFALQRRAALDGHYSALFKSLNLTPDQLEKFKTLLVDKSTATADVAMAAREQGVNPRTDRDAYRKLLADAQANVDADIRAVLGDAGFAQYQHYEQTQPQRSVVGQLEQRLSYTPTPLSSEQSAQLVNILANASSATLPGGPGFANRTAAGLLGVNTGQAAISEAAINQSLGLLAGPQIDALRQLQQEQQAQAELGAAMRREFQAARQTAPAPQPSAGKGGD